MVKSFGLLHREPYHGSWPELLMLPGGQPDINPMLTRRESFERITVSLDDRLKLPIDIKIK